MAITLLSPENSFIQFIGIDDEATPVTCGISFTTCLPITEGDDYSFMFYINGELDSSLFDNYFVRLRSQDETVVSTETQVEWLYDDVDDKTWGYVTTDFNIAAFAALGGCSNFILSRKTFNYSYNLTTVTYPENMVFTLTINGEPTAAGGGSPISSITDIITVLQVVLGANAVVTQSLSGFINIQSVGGDVYGILTITTGDVRHFIPVATSFLTDEYISNCLIYVENKCFTRVVKYKGNENQFGFNYELAAAYTTDFYNSVRLPIYIDNPQPVIDENYFLLSDGTKKVLAARYEKEYEGHTEYFDEDMHFRFLAAMKHDTFLLGDTFSTVEEYTAEGKYDIGWLSRPGSNIGNAPATFKVRPTPFFQQNSNCVTV